MSLLLRIYDPEECGADGYPSAWHRASWIDNERHGAIKDEIRAEAGHRCERCRHPYISKQHGNGEWSPCDEQCTHDGPTRNFGGRLLPEAQWRILTVHHLNGIKYDCRWWNLAALCQRCHLAIQGRVRMEQVYPYEHSEWFKPHAAGYYASIYLDEDLTREETLARLDELLALEQMA